VLAMKDMKDKNLRRRMARWLDPDTGVGPAREPAAPAHLQTQPLPQVPVGPRVAPDVWPAICERFALRMLGHAESLRPALDRLEADEHDEERLQWLYHVDHSVTRMRRAVRDLRILAGVEEGEMAGYTSSIIDVIRAAESAIEHYSKVVIGRVVDLAVVPYASDDVSSLLAAILDNATSYSPSTVTVSAHLLDSGSVMLRIEDSGIGMSSGHFEVLNAALAGPVPELSEHVGRHTGFPVMHRVARKFGVSIRFAARSNPDSGAPGGTLAMVTIPPDLLCEIPNEGPAMVRPDTMNGSSGSSPAPAPHAVPPASPPSTPRLSVAPAHGTRTPARETQTPAREAQVTRPVQFGEPAGTGRRAPRPDPERSPITGAITSSVSELPRRTPTSLRGDGDGRVRAPRRTSEKDTSAAARSFAEDLTAFTAGEQAGRQRPAGREQNHEDHRDHQVQKDHQDQSDGSEGERQ
jgi:histidine kinase/DNA gyrase B/HSP90-like ATPase